jgi:type VI secretion system secreted protein Hcp
MFMKSILTVLATALALAFAAAPRSAHAAVDAFIYFEGVNGPVTVQGETKDNAYAGKKAFEIKDFSFGVENPTTIGSATQGAGAGKIKFNEFTITKHADASSPVLHGICTAGRHIPQAEIIVRKAGGGDRKDVTVTIYRMTDVACVRFDEGPTEKLTFTYGKLTVEYHKQDSTPSNKQGWAPTKPPIPPAAKLQTMPGVAPPQGGSAPPITVRGLRQAGGACVAQGTAPPSPGHPGWGYQLTSPPPTGNSVPILIRLTGLTANDIVHATFIPTPAERINPLQVNVGGASALMPTAIAQLTEQASGPAAAAMISPCWQAQLSLSRRLP